MLRTGKSALRSALSNPPYHAGGMIEKFVTIRENRVSSSSVFTRVPLWLILSCMLSLWVWTASQARAADQPQWGHAWSRNMVSEERGLPDSFNPKTGQNIK